MGSVMASPATAWADGGGPSGTVALVRRGVKAEGRLGETMAYLPEAGAEVEDPGGEGFEVDDELVGETLGQYRLDELVGLGSMGRVYRGEHLWLRRPCAVKVMNPGLLSGRPEVRERFWAEARAVAQLLHPHVVTVHNLGSDRGYHYIEMEYVPGGVSLREAVIRDGPLDPARASTLVRQVALALDEAHRSGLVHRDVKPANVLINESGRAKLADFGLVRRVSELDRAGAVPVAGTPTYMAPELFEGVPASRRSDLYAVGVMYYYLLSARLPFASDQITQLIARHRDEPAPDVRGVAPETPEAVAALVARCLAKRPGDRPDSAADLAAELQGVVYQLRDTEGLVRESVEGLDCYLQGARDNFRALLKLPTGRLQEVYIEAGDGPHGERLLTAFSVCGPAEPANYEYALRLNDKLSHGSLSVRTVNGQPVFVMHRTLTRDHASAAEVRTALLEIARRSDRVEQQLTGADIY